MSGQIFWLEVMGKPGEVLSRQKFQGQATLGRGYRCDLVLDDPHVAAEHLRLEEDDAGHLWAVDLGSSNGSIADVAPDQREPITRLLIAEEARLILGNTHVRVRTAAFVVPTEVPVRAAPPASAFRSDFSTAVLMLVVLMALSTGETWLGQVGEQKFSAYLLPLLITPLVGLVWAGSWTMVTRILNPAGRFSRHCFIVFSCLIAFFLLDKAARFLEYSLSLTGVGKFESLLNWAVLAVLCFLHLRLVVPRHPRLMGGIVAALAVIGIVAQGTVNADQEKQSTLASGPIPLMPPFMQMRSPHTAADFFAQAEQLKKGLDVERKKEPAPGGLFSSDGE